LFSSDKKRRPSREGKRRTLSPSKLRTLEPTGMRRELIEALAGVMLFREIRENIRSHNGKQFVAKAGMGTRRTEQGSLPENGNCETFDGELRDECLSGEAFYTLREAQIVIEKQRVRGRREGTTELMRPRRWR
jgi:hypothetical protein